MDNYNLNEIENINDYIDKNNNFNYNVSEWNYNNCSSIFIGNCECIKINDPKILNLKLVKCENLYLSDDEYPHIKSHNYNNIILPNNLTYLSYVNCGSIIYNCVLNFPKILPDKIKIIKFDNCNIKYIPNNLPNSLKILEFDNCNLEFIPQLPDNIELSIKQKIPIKKLHYNENIKINNSNFIIDGYNDNNPITNQEEWDEYMRLLSNKVKSGRK